MNMKVILLKLGVGIALGATVGALLAPQQGTKTRQQLAQGVARLRSRANQVASTVRESDTGRRLAEGGARVGTRVVGAASSVGQQIGRTVEGVRQGRSSDSGDAAEYERLHEEYESLRQELEEEQGKPLSSSRAWLLMGGLMGLAIGVLMAPKPGGETRKDLAKRAQRLKGQAERMASDF